MPSDTVIVPNGYDSEVVIRWGDPILPGVPGLEATRRIVAGAPASAVLVLTMVDDDDTVPARAVDQAAVDEALRGRGL